MAETHVSEIWYKVAEGATGPELGWVAGWFADYLGKGERRFAKVHSRVGDKTFLVITDQASPHLRVRQAPTLTAATTGRTLVPGTKVRYMSTHKNYAEDTGGPSDPPDPPPDPEDDQDVSTEPAWKKWLPKVLIGVGAAAVTLTFLLAPKKPKE